MVERLGSAHTHSMKESSVVPSMTWSGASTSAAAHAQTRQSSTSVVVSKSHDQRCPLIEPPFQPNSP